MPRYEAGTGFRLALRSVVVAWGAWVARDAYQLTLRYLDGYIYGTTAAAWITCAAFLLTPVRWLARSALVTVLLAAPFAVWIASVMHEADPFSWRFNWGWMLWYPTPLAIQLLLVRHRAARRREAARTLRPAGTAT